MAGPDQEWHSDVGDLFYHPPADQARRGPHEQVNVQPQHSHTNGGFKTLLPNQLRSLHVAKKLSSSSRDTWAMPSPRGPGSKTGPSIANSNSQKEALTVGCIRFQIHRMVCNLFKWFVAVRQGGGPGGRGGKFAKGGKEGPDAREEHLPPHGLIALTPLVDVEAGGGVTEFFTASHATVDGPAPQAGGGAPAQGQQSTHCQRPASTGPANVCFFKNWPSVDVDGAHWLVGLGRQLQSQCAAAKRWPG